MKTHLGLTEGPYRKIIPLPTQAAGASGLFGALEPPLGYVARMLDAGVEFGEAITGAGTNFQTLQFNRVVGVTATAVGSSRDSQTDLAAHTKAQLIKETDLVEVRSSERLKLNNAATLTGAALPEGHIYLEYKLMLDARGRM